MRIENIEKLERLRDELRLTEAQVQQALRSAVNSVVRTVAVNTANRASRSADVQKKIIRNRIMVYRSQRQGIRAGLSVIANSVPASLLNPRSTKRGGVTARSHRYRGGFIAQGKAKRRKVFERVGESRYPLFERRVPVENELKNALAQAVGEVEELFLKRLDNQLRRKGGLFGDRRR